MMPSLPNTNTMFGGVSHFPHIPKAGHTTDAMLDELSRQLHAAQHATRVSRCPNTSNQRPGNARRITKPGSASNSPRSAMIQSRRRTMIGEVPYGRLQPSHQAEPSYLPTPVSEAPNDSIYECDNRPARPVSWHPGSHQMAHYQQGYQQQQQQQQTMPYVLPQCSDTDLYSNYQQFPPTPAAYSAYTSPTAALSPLSLPYSNTASQQYISPATRSIPASQGSGCQPTSSPDHKISSTVSEIPYLPAPKTLDWDTFAVQGFAARSAPPTPEDFVQAPKPEIRLATEDAIPFQPLEDDEPEGEILYGMGLYDLPDKDPLDFHLSTVFSLLGSKGAYPEPTGKGLKLEDAWQPPLSDDEDDEDDEDGEERDADEEA